MAVNLISERPLFAPKMAVNPAGITSIVVGAIILALHKKLAENSIFMVPGWIKQFAFLNSNEVKAICYALAGLLFILVGCLVIVKGY
jgi:hypothetical protein